MPDLSKTFGKLTIPLLVLLAICFWALPAEAKYGGGTGEPNDPYLIFTAEQMNEIGLSVNWEDWDKHFLLCADIDLASFTGTSFNIIGTAANPFTGVFDGSGHTISNFTYTSTDRNGIGLFGYVRGENAEIKDLGLIDPNVDAGTGSLVGLLVGEFREGAITNCYAENGSVVGDYGVGGLVGAFLMSDEITNCYSTGSVTGNDDVGGLVGFSFYGSITDSFATGSVTGHGPVGGLVGNFMLGYIADCYSTGSVTGEGYVGGLVGWNRGTITNCYSTGSVSGDCSVGGLVGRNGEFIFAGLYFATISNCYGTGSVTGTGDRVGGLVGWNDWGEINDSFWDTQTSGQASSDGGTGKTTAEMQTISTFTDAGWDFTTPVWKMNCEGMSYPKLSWWQPVLGDFGCPDGVDMRGFAVLAAQWRQPPGEPSADIAPDGGDGIVDRFDLAALVDNWLADK